MLYRTRLAFIGERLVVSISGAARMMKIYITVGQTGYLRSHSY
jgi:hypothetical protein